MDNPAYIALAIVGSFVLLIIVLWFRAKAPVKTLRALADSMGFTFIDELDSDLRESLMTLPFFKVREEPRAWNDLLGERDGFSVTTMDFIASRRSSGNNNMRIRSAVVFESSEMQLPSLAKV